MRSVAVTLLVIGLLGGATAAFGLTEALKLERSPIAAPDFTKRFSPICRCPEQRAQLIFRLRKATVNDVLAQLPPELRQLADLLQDSPMAEAARILGVARTTLYGRVRKLRQRFEEKGLRHYL